MRWKNDAGQSVEILKLAEEKKCAVGAFNTPNLECVNAVLAAAEKAMSADAEKAMRVFAGL